MGLHIDYFSGLAFSVYVWLLRVTSPALVSTYAFVNPIVAVYLGWAIADETLSGRIVVAATVIILGVVMITGFGGRGRRKFSEGTEASEPHIERDGSPNSLFSSSGGSERL